MGPENGPETCRLALKQENQGGGYIQQYAECHYPKEFFVGQVFIQQEKIVSVIQVKFEGVVIGQGTTPHMING